MYKQLVDELGGYFTAAWRTESAPTWTEPEVQRPTGTAEEPFGTQSTGSWSRQRQIKHRGEKQ